MRPSFATVVSHHAWEPELALASVRHNTARLVGRCSGFDEVKGLAPDVVVIGTESPLAAPDAIGGWRRAGIAVMVVHDTPDPALRRLSGLCDAMFERSTHPGRLMAAMASIASPACRPAHQILTVTGPRGTPGRSEVSLALAWASAERRQTTLVDLDLEAPSLSFRLGLPPFTRPEVAEVGPIRLAGFPPAAGPLAAHISARLIAAWNEQGPVVVDAGPNPSAGRSLPVVVVGDGSDLGLIRLRRFLVTRSELEPIIVINRAGPDSGISRLGVEPAVVIPNLAAGSSRQPIEGMVDLLRPLVATAEEPHAVSA